MPDLWSPMKANSKLCQMIGNLPLWRGALESEKNLMSKTGKSWPFGHSLQRPIATATILETSWNFLYICPTLRDSGIHDVWMPMEWAGCTQTLDSIFWSHPISLVVRCCPEYPMSGSTFPPWFCISIKIKPQLEKHITHSPTNYDIPCKLPFGRWIPLIKIVFPIF